MRSWASPVHRLFAFDPIGRTGTRPAPTPILCEDGLHLVR
jgi:hypothetical protein